MVASSFFTLLLFPLGVVARSCQGIEKRVVNPGMNGAYGVGSRAWHYRPHHVSERFDSWTNLDPVDSVQVVRIF